MHTEMWEHPAVQDNLATLRRRGVTWSSPSRAAWPAATSATAAWPTRPRIVAAVEAALTAPDLAGLQVLVTAGGTREPIDPVRFLGNRSSGKQGHALAAAAARRGATVTLVTTAPLPAPGRRRGGRGRDGRRDAHGRLGRARRRRRRGDGRRRGRLPPGRRGRPRSSRRPQGIPEIRLEPTVDILAGLGAAKRRRPDAGGLRRRDHRRGRQRPGASWRAKGVDLLVANDVSAPGRRLRARHQRRRHLQRRRRGRIEVPLASKDAGGRRGARRCGGPPPTVVRFAKS